MTPRLHKSNVTTAGCRGGWVDLGGGWGGRGPREFKNGCSRQTDRQKGTEVEKQADEPGSSQLHCFTLQKISVCAGSTIKPNCVFDTGLFGVGAGPPVIRQENNPPNTSSSSSRSPMEHSSRGWGGRGGSAPHWGVRQDVGAPPTPLHPPRSPLFLLLLPPLIIPFPDSLGLFLLGLDLRGGSVQLLRVLRAEVL